MDRAAMKIALAELHHTDCMEYMANLPDKAFDLAIVDPPYRERNDPLQSMRALCEDRMKDFGKKPGMEYFSELGRISRNQIVWGANNFIECLKNTNCFIFWHKKNPADNYSDGELAWTSFDGVARCFEYTYYGNHSGVTKAETKIHPTQKPVILYEWLLRHYAQPGQRILDTHLGSGSSAIAANNLGFELVGCEINEGYYRAAAARVKQASEQMRLFA